MDYPDLYALLDADPKAKKFFNQLPDYAKAQINTRPQGIGSFDDLKDYAENILRGDG